MKILLVDDHPELVEIFLGVLNQAYPDAVVELRTYPSQALEVYEREPFNISFIDLKLRDGEQGSSEYIGIQLGSMMHDKNGSCAIVMYSADIERGRENEFSHYNDCISAGAVDVIARSTLFSYPAATLKTKTDEWIANHRGKTTPHVELCFSDDLRTLGFSETVGEDTVRALVAKSIPEFKTHLVSALKAGYSGSLVALIESQQTAEGGTKAINVLKIGQDLFALKDELKRAPLSGSIQADISRYLDSQIVQYAGWYAAKIPFVRDASPLREILRGRRKLKKNDVSSIRNVFEKSLIKPAQEVIGKPEDARAQGFVFRYSFAAQVTDFLEDFSDWRNVIANKYRRKSAVVLDCMPRLVAQNAVWNLDKHLYARLHGDFHSSNVFVTDRGEPVVIDFGRADLFPRLFDFGALDVDLMLSVLNSEDGKCLNFDMIEEWCECLFEQYPFRKDVRVLENSRVERARSIMLGMMLEQLDHVTPIEYAAVTLVHVLRYLRFDVTPAKKTLGVLWAARLIEKFDF